MRYNLSLMWIHNGMKWKCKQLKKRNYHESHLFDGKILCSPSFTGFFVTEIEVRNKVNYFNFKL